MEGVQYVRWYSCMEIKGQLCGFDSLLYVDSGNRTPVAVLAWQGLDLPNHPMSSHINFCLCSPDMLHNACVIAIFIGYLWLSA